MISHLNVHRIRLKGNDTIDLENQAKIVISQAKGHLIWKYNHVLLYLKHLRILIIDGLWFFFHEQSNTCGIIGCRTQKRNLFETYSVLLYIVYCQRMMIVQWVARVLCDI